MIIPSTYKEATNSPEVKQWIEAAIGMKITSLAKYKVYKPVPITSVPKEEKILGTRELIKRRRTTVHHVPTQAMLADIVTKYFQKHKFNSVHQEIGDFKC